jgi:SAM-dependent methyltransferase
VVALDVIEPGPRRPWNAFWSMYDLLLAAGLEGKCVLVPGCGFGEDAIRLSRLGAHVYGFDLSPEIVAIAKQRAATFAGEDVVLDVMPSETMTYPANFFDAVVFVDILHHVDIERTMAEVRRVMKPGGMIIGDELYTHSALQWVRESRLVSKVLYPRMQRFIYGTDKPYITEDEHKIDNLELAIVKASMTGGSSEWFGALEGRLYPNHIRWAAKIDRAFMRLMRGAGSVLGSRVVFQGIVKKD